MPNVIIRRLLHTTILSIAIIHFSYSQSLVRLPYASYNVNEGLLHSQVTDIAEDGNGFIWLSMGNGVQRFDGTKFHTIPVSTDNKGLLGDSYARFLKLQNGNLWLKHDKGISEYDHRTNRFKTIIKTKEPIPARDRLICEEEDGIWFIINHTFYKIDKRTHDLTDSISFQTLTPSRDYIPVVIPDNTKGTSHFGLYNFRELVVIDKVTRKEKKILPENESETFIKVDYFKKDTLLIVTPLGVKKLDLLTGQFTSIAMFSATSIHVTITVLNEKTWLTSDGSRLFEFDPVKGNYVTELVNFQKKPLVNVGYITLLFFDSRKNLWILTENDGVRKINYMAPKFRHFGVEDRSENFVKSIFVNKKENVVLCGTFGSGLQIYDTTGNLLKSIKQIPGIRNQSTVCGFHQLAPHQYILFTQGKWDVFELNTKNYQVNKIRIDSSKVSLINDADYHLTTHPLNDSLFLVQNSFYVYTFKWVEPRTIVPLSVADLSVASVSSTAATDKRFWVGGRDGKYFIFSSSLDKFREYSLPQLVLIRCLDEDRTGAMWIGTEKGLYCIQKDTSIVKIYNKSNGLPDENIYSVRVDESGNIWCSHNKGITCIRKDQRMFHFSNSDGLQENEFNTNTSFKTSDHELFFGGVNGISSFYPEETLRSAIEPDVLLTNIKIKDQDWKKDTAYWNLNKIVLPHYSNMLSFEFTTIGIRTKDSYQYQLVGQDEDWVHSETGKQVLYILEPGDYILRYTSGNSPLSDAAHVKELHIIIRPPFWKTTGFMISMGILLTVLIIIITRTLTRAKLKRRIYELERIKELDEERTRISREMHDDIGAGLTQIILKSEAAKRTEAKHPLLDEITSTSRKLVGNINEIIWSLNPENNSLEQLLAYMREQLHRLLEHSGIGYSIEFTDQGNNVFLDNVQRRNLLLINKEIAHNAIKHSKANQLFISCRYENSKLEFTITDNGIGFEPEKKLPGYGLENIRHRIQELGGELRISSSDIGTMFQFKVPLKH